MRSCKNELLKLFQKPQIVLIQRSKIVELRAALHKRRPFDAPTEGESGIFLGIQTRGFEHVRVQHAGTAEFQPAGLAGAAFLFVGSETGAVAHAAGDV